MQGQDPGETHVYHEYGTHDDSGTFERSGKRALEPASQPASQKPMNFPTPVSRQAIDEVTTGTQVSGRAVTLGQRF